MDNQYLQELIQEAKARGGGLLLSTENSPAAVVLTVEKYNSLISNSKLQMSNDEQTTLELMTKNKLNIENENRKVLVTGGAGYIGAHLTRELIKAGYQVTVLDNLSSGKRENIDPRANFIEGDLADENLLKDIFSAGGFYAVFHMAASIEVEESVREPEKYLVNNALNTAKLLKAMAEYGVSNIIFSSTCAVYKEILGKQYINEQSEVGPVSPYGYSKLIAEKIIEYYTKYTNMRAVIFRYFNACGFDSSARIQPTHESHLISKVMEVATGKRPALIINGADYETIDGTCVRDYVHVLDIAQPHILALNHMATGEPFKLFNIGTGHGSSVKEVVAAASEVLGKIIPMEVGPRRPGDAMVTVADNSKLTRELGYNLQYSDLPTIIKTTWDSMN